MKELIKWLENEVRLAQSFNERVAYQKVIDKVKGNNNG